MEANSSRWNEVTLAEPLTDLVRELDADLVFALSLGSKELFHTNLLGWFVEQYPGVAEVLLAEWDAGQPPTPIRASREWQHLDLLSGIHLHDARAAIDGTGTPTRVITRAGR